MGAPSNTWNLGLRANETEIEGQAGGQWGGTVNCRYTRHIYVI